MKGNRQGSEDNLFKEGRVWNRRFSKRNLRRYLVSFIRETFNTLIIRCHLTPLRKGEDKMRGQSVLATIQRNWKPCTVSA